MKRYLVGGNFDESKKRSSVAKKIADSLYANIYNGGREIDVERAIDFVSDGDLIIWMPNIQNEVPKHYPKKKVGAVLICSKVLRENRDEGDAISRIFKMQANAVLAIDTSSNPFKFKLIDALGNLWIETSDLNLLSNTIEKFVDWIKNSIRVNTKQYNFCDTNEIIEYNKEKLETLSEIVKIISTKVTNERGGRYFGDCSTRCEKTFPSMRTIDAGIMVSKRNVSKEFISKDDFIWTTNKFTEDKSISYIGNNKPSVDTPVQLKLYDHFYNINYFIHGHAYIDNIFTTEEYFPCGDMREANTIIELFNKNSEVICINLKNHGFLIGTTNLHLLKNIAELYKFIYRPLPEPI